MNSLLVSVRSHADESYWELLSFSTAKCAAQGDKLALWSRKLYHLQTWKQTYKLEYYLFLQYYPLKEKNQMIKI